MAKFCGKCGSPLNDTAVFCGGCGAQAPAQGAAPASAPLPAAVPATPFATVPVAQYAAAAPPVAPYSPTPGYVPGTLAPPPVKKSNTLVKVVVVCVALLFVGGALALGGLWYAAQQVKAKAAAAAAQSPGLSGVVGAVGGLMGSVASNGDDPRQFTGDPCRFLSKEEVSRAVGLPVIRADAKDNGCSYIAKGDPADVTAKHMASMLGGMGADAKTQKTIQGLAGGLFAQQEAGDKSLTAQAATGEVPVLAVDYTVGNAKAIMKLNRSGFQYVTGGVGTAASSGSGDLDGIGDEAYLAGGSMLMFRKGDTTAHFMYTSCPCNTDNIKPLAKLAAERL